MTPFLGFGSVRPITCSVRLSRGCFRASTVRYSTIRIQRRWRCPSSSLSKSVTRSTGKNHRTTVAMLDRRCHVTQIAACSFVGFARLTHGRLSTRFNDRVHLHVIRATRTCSFSQTGFSFTRHAPLVSPNLLFKTNLIAIYCGHENRREIL